MADKEINLRRLVIKAFHMTDVEWGEENTITTDGHMTVSKGMLEQLTAEDDCIEKIDIQIIKPGDHDRWTNTIMDIIPISTKVLGKLGEGITHTVTGVYVMLTGVDVDGKQCHEFGSSEGNLKDQLYLNRAGTPGDDDYIISFDVTFASGMGQERHGPFTAHRLCDEFIQTYREKLKKFKGEKCTERHEYHDKVRPGKKRVLIIRQVAGQGAMYDTHLFPDEPSGVEGGKSIIEMGNMPVMLYAVGGVSMGIGPSTKETSLHHFRDPLLEVVAEDTDLDLMGLIIVGTPDDNKDKIRVGTRAAAMAEMMRADGVIISSDGWGNSDVDFTNTCEQLGIRDIPVTGLNFSGTVAQFVVVNDYLDGIVDINKSADGTETDVVGENNMVKLDCLKAKALLKLKMRQKEQRRE